MNGCVVPNGMEVSAGATVIEANAAGVTVSVAVPLILPTEAVMVVLPAAALCAKPVEFVLATAVTLELQAAVLVRF